MRWKEVGRSIPIPCPILLFCFLIFPWVVVMGVFPVPFLMYGSNNLRHYTAYMLPFQIWEHEMQACIPPFHARRLPFVLLLSIQQLYCRALKTHYWISFARSMGSPRTPLGRLLFLLPRGLKRPILGSTNVLWRSWASLCQSAWPPQECYWRFEWIFGRSLYNWWTCFPVRTISSNKFHIVIRMMRIDLWVQRCRLTLLWQQFVLFVLGFFIFYSSNEWNGLPIARKNTSAKKTVQND